MEQQVKLYMRRIEELKHLAAEATVKLTAAESKHAKMAREFKEFVTSCPSEKELPRLEKTCLELKEFHGNLMAQNLKVQDKINGARQENVHSKLTIIVMRKEMLAAKDAGERSEQRCTTAKYKFQGLKQDIEELKREEDKNEMVFNEHIKEQTLGAMMLKHILGNERLRMQEGSKRLLEASKRAGTARSDAPKSPTTEDLWSPKSGNNTGRDGRENNADHVKTVFQELKDRTGVDDIDELIEELQLCKTKTFQTESELGKINHELVQLNVERESLCMEINKHSVEGNSVLKQKEVSSLLESDLLAVEEACIECATKIRTETRTLAVAKEHLKLLYTLGMCRDDKLERHEALRKGEPMDDSGLVQYLGIVESKVAEVIRKVRSRNGAGIASIDAGEMLWRNPTSEVPKLPLLQESKKNRANAEGDIARGQSDLSTSASPFTKTELPQSIVAPNLVDVDKLFRLGGYREENETPRLMSRMDCYEDVKSRLAQLVCEREGRHHQPLSSPSQGMLPPGMRQSSIQPVRVHSKYNDSPPVRRRHGLRRQSVRQGLG